MPPACAGSASLDNSLLPTGLRRKRPGRCRELPAPAGLARRPPTAYL